MKKNVVSISLILVVLSIIFVLFTNYKKPETPIDVVNSFTSDIKKGNLSDALSYVSPEKLKFIRKIIPTENFSNLEKFMKYANLFSDIPYIDSINDYSINIISEETDDDSAVVYSEISNSNLDNKYKVNFKLIKNGEKWYINSVNFDNGE